MVLTRPSAAGGQTITVPGAYRALQRYHLSWEHGPEGSSLLYHGGSPIDGSPVSVSADVLEGADRLRIVAGYLKLAAQSQSDDEKAINVARRARRDRIRALRSI